jgi:hypothetical protein
MDQNNIQIEESIKKLGRLFAEFRDLPFPSIKDLDALVNLVDLISDIQVDLADEDGYLAGLVDTYLARKRIEVNEIRIDITIDSRLTHVIKELKGCQEIVQKIITYRQKMLEIASTLSRASKVPITQ